MGERHRSESFYLSLLLITTGVWGMSFIWSKMATNSGLSPEMVLFLRYTLASILLLPFSLKELRNLTGKKFRGGCIMGIIFFLGMFFQTEGISRSTPGNASFITTAYVVISPLTTWIMTKKKPGRQIVLASLVCLVGIYILSMSPGETLSLNLGNVLTFIGAFFWAVQLSYTSIVGVYVGPLLLSFLSFSVTGILGFVVSLVRGSLFTVTISQVKLAAPAIILAAIFPTIVGNLVQVYAQPRVDPNKAAMVYSLEAVFATVLSIILGLEKWNVTVVVGGCLIIAAVMIAQFGGGQRGERQQTNS